MYQHWTASGMEHHTATSAAVAKYPTVLANWLVAAAVLKTAWTRGCTIGVYALHLPEWLGDSADPKGQRPCSTELSAMR